MFEDSDISPKLITGTLFVFLTLVLTIFILSLELWETKRKFSLAENAMEYIESSTVYEDIPYTESSVQEEAPKVETSITVQKPSQVIQTESPDIPEEVIPEESTDKGYDGKLDGKYGLFQSFFSHESWGTSMTRASFTNTWGEENIEVQEDASVKVSYPKGSYVPSKDPRGGAGFIYAIGEKYEELNLSYEITLAENFNFVKWGKLPWICWGDCSRWGEDASDGFSANFVWKADGYLDTSISSHNSSSSYGDTTGKKYFQMKAGNTYKLKQYIKLNTPGANNGIFVVYIDDREVYRSENEDFRNKTDIQMDSVLFSTFFSGWDTSWATPVDTSIVFNNFEINGK